MILVLFFFITGAISLCICAIGFVKDCYSIKIWGGIFAGILLSIAIGIGGWFFASYCKADSYNRRYEKNYKAEDFMFYEDEIYSEIIQEKTEEKQNENKSDKYYLDY